METTNALTRTQKMIVASDFPTFISTVYLVTKPSPKVVQTMSRIEDAFNMWGKTITPTPPGEFAYFTSPLSYPFEFSQKGIEQISLALKKIPEVDPQSISLRTFPNIATIDQKRYPKIFSKELIFEEQYISFRLTDWGAIEFKRFLTFLVISFDYSTASVGSPEAYRKISEYWRKKIETFNSNHKLMEVLGISVNSAKFRDIPILTFVSAGFYHDIKYMNRYFGGSVDRKKRFLTEVSLRPSMAEQARLIGLNFLMHEYDQFTRWRFYYSPEPFFYTGDWRRSTYPGGVQGPSAKLGQVLRTALFVHVVLPNSANQCLLDLSEVEKNLLELQKNRIDFLDQFSAADLSNFQRKLIDIYKVRTELNYNTEKADEVLSGLDTLKLFMASAFEIRRRDTFDSTDKIPDGIFDPNLSHEFFHFNRNASFHNDREKANRYRRLIQNRLEKTKKTVSLLHGEISEASSLLESRRNMIESEKNTVLAIIIPALGALLFGAVWLWLVIRR